MLVIGLPCRESTYDAKPLIYSLYIVLLVATYTHFSFDHSVLRTLNYIYVNVCIGMYIIPLAIWLLAT